MTSIFLREIKSTDQEWIKKISLDLWNSVEVVSQHKIYYTDKLSGILAIYQDTRAGLLLYSIDQPTLNIISLNTLYENIGIGSKLIERIEKIGIKKRLKKVRITTTNDNIDALRFYQAKGFQIINVNVDIMKKYRKLKPGLPKLGFYNIEIRDEFVLEKPL